MEKKKKEEEEYKLEVTFVEKTNLFSKKRR